MKREDIIRMAREAGGTAMRPFDYGAKSDQFIMSHEDLERFAQLVAAAERNRLATELGKMPLNDTAHSIAIWIRSQQ